ncbi:MAG: porin [Gemmatimonadaceae bacterium]
MSTARLAELEGAVRRLDSTVARMRATSGTGLDVRLSSSGFVAQSADGRYVLRLRGYFQSDTRIPLGSAAADLSRGLLLRRVRPIWEASLGKVADVRLMPDFGEGRPTIYDAHLDLHFTPALNLRSGKFKPPVGLERLQSATDIAFIERAHPNSLVPNRDVGTQLYGDLSRAVSYAVGVFNGVPDIGFGDVDTDRFKDLVGRVAVEPLKWRKTPTADELVLGLSGSRGEHRGTVSAPQLQTYKSPMQESVFHFRGDGTAAGTVVADGPQQRLSPHAYAALSRVSAMGEYVVSTQAVRRATTSTTLRQRAWEVTGVVNLTGEHASFRGLTPRRPFDPGKHAFGALELAVRASALTVDPDAFPLLADPASQVQRAATRGVGLNWHLVKGVKVMVDYTNTRFRGGASTGDRPAEHNLSTRFQHAF